MDRGGKGDGSPRPFRKEFQRVHECRGIRSRLMRKQLQHAGVAALFFEFAQLAGGPAGDRVPPKNRRGRQFQQPDEIVAAANVHQLVGDDRSLRIDAQPGEERNSAE